MAPIDSSSSILIEFLLTVNIKDSRDSETGSQTDDYLYHGIDFLRQFQLNNKYYLFIINLYLLKIKI